MRSLGPTDIENIALGAAVLGSGGGGDPHVGKLMALQAVQQHGPVHLIDVDEVPDDAVVVPISMMGAPTVLVEKIPSADEDVVAFNALQDYLGTPIFATMPIEAGGVNSMIPLALGARLGIPVVDADAMGRAFPEYQMVTFHLHGLRGTPEVLTDEKGNSLVIRTVSNEWTERLARAATVQMGGSTMDASFAVTGEQLRQAGIPGIVTLTQRIGEALLDDSPIQRVLEVARGVSLFAGKVVDVVRRTDGGFVRGEAYIDGPEGRLALEFQNENLIARVGDRVLATTPDLIVALDAETAHPVTTEGLRYGMRVVVVGIPCNEQWRTPKGIETVGPRYFGYDLDYVPLEELAEKEA